MHGTSVVPRKRFTLLSEHKSLCILMLLSMIALFLAHQTWSPEPLFVDVGREGDEHYVKGFHQREGSKRFSYRWTTDSSTIRFPDIGYMPAKISLAMDGARPEGHPPPNVAVTANGETGADFAVPNGIRAYEFDHFPSSFPFPRDLLVEIKTETFVPAESNDFRTLGVLVNTVEARPIHASLSFPLLVVSLEIALAGTLSMFLCYVILQRMRIPRWSSLGLCGLLVASLVLNIVGRFVASRLVLTLLPLFFLSSYGVAVLVESIDRLARNGGWALRPGAILTSFKQILPNLLLAFLATLFTLLAIEIGFRVRVHLENQKTLEALESGLELSTQDPTSLAYRIRLSENPRIIYELRPNISVTYQDGLITISTNEEGFRSESYSVQTYEDTFRIVGLGDSIMFGWGVSDGEPYLAQLENQLNQTFPDRRWEVINTAVPGYNTVMEVETLKEKGLKYEPNIVIVEFVFNDLALPNFIREKESPFTLQKSFLVEFLSESIGHSQHVDKLWDPTLQKLGLVPAPKDEEHEMYFESDPSKVPPQYRDMVGWDSYVKAMKELKSLREEYGFEVISISLEYSDYALKRQALELSEELGFHVMDVGPALRQYMQQNGIQSYRGSPLAVSEADGHPSAIVHKIASEELFRYLTQENLIAAQ